MADLSDEFNLGASIERTAKAKETIEEMHEYTERITAFIECCQTGTVQDVDAFIKKYPQLNIHDPVLNLLFFTGKEKNWGVVKHLIEKYKCDPHLHKENILCQLAADGQLAMVEYLVKEHDADIHASNDSALSYACLREHYDVVEFLLEQGADASEIPAEGPWEAARVTCDTVVQNMAKKKYEAQQNKIQQANLSKVKGKIGYSPVRRRPRKNAK